MEMKTHHQVTFALLIAFAVIAFWRGVWGLLDEFLLPEQLILSYLISMIIGILILVLTHYLGNALI